METEHTRRAFGGILKYQRSASQLLEDIAQSGRLVRLDNGRLCVVGGDPREDLGDLDEARRRSIELVGYLASQRAPTRLPSIRRALLPNRFPLTVAQEQWADIYRTPVQEQWLPLIWRIRERIDPSAFVRSYERVLHNHEILRTRYVEDNGAMLQEVLPDVLPSLGVFDLSESPADEAERELYDHLKPTFAARVGLDKGPMRLDLYRLGPEHYILGGSIHHVAMDGISFQIFIRDLMRGYFAEASGQKPRQAPSLRYGDFAAWERSWLNNEERSLAYAQWEHLLANAQPLRLPGGRAHQGPPDQARTAEFRVQDRLFLAAQQLARQSGVTLNILFLAILSMVLGRMAQQSQALFASVCSGRPVGAHDMIGCFMQLRPFYISFADDPRFEDLLVRARKAASAVSDIRKPVSPELMSRLDVGNVLVNYVQIKPNGASTRLSQDRINASQDTNPRHTEFPSVVASDADHSVSADPTSDGAKSWRTADHISSAATSRAFAAGISTLHRLLVDEFSRDLHFAVQESTDALSVRITYPASRFTRAGVLDISTMVVTGLSSVIRSPALPVSKLFTSP